MSNPPPLVKNQIAMVIKAAFKPYEASIKDTESSYKLKTLALQADSLNLNVNKNIMRFFELYKRRTIRQIHRKIESQDKPPEFSLRDVKLMLRKNKINKEVSTAVINAIKSPMLINLSLEDCYTAFKHLSKICSLNLDCNNGLKNRFKLAKAKSVIVIIYGTYKIKLNDLKRYWDIITSKVPPKTPISFSYNVKYNLKKEKMYALIGY